MIAPTAVEIVRPKPDFLELVGMLIGSIANVFVSAWIAMLCVGALGHSIGYWTAFLIIIAARAVLPRSGWEYRMWTRVAKR